MAYRFETGETVPESFARCHRERLDRSIEELTEGVKVDRVKAVHAARKSIKMERSLLRLVRGAVRPAARDRANETLRDAARRLSGARDADVMLEALDMLSERYAGQLPEATFAAVRARLQSDRDRMRETFEVSGELTVAVRELEEIRARDLKLRRDGWKAIGEGLERSYRRGRRAMTRAHRSPTVENLHAWRKRVKDLWYHARLLEAAAPRTLAGFIDEAHALSDLLGDDHDLAVLRTTVTSLATQVPSDLGPILALIDHRREQLQGEARLVGARVYAEKPKQFTRRMRRYWKASARAIRASGSETGAAPALLTRQAAVV